MKALILGSDGYIGKHLYAQLTVSENSIQCADINEIGFFQKSNYKKVDIRNKESILQLDLDVDFIFLFSGLTGTGAGFSNYQQFIDINEIGLLNILDILKEKKLRSHIVFPSTRLVYKGQPGKMLTEESEKEAKTIYALNKLAGERILKMYQNMFDIPFSVFRICLPYGNSYGDYSYGTVGFMTKQAVNEKSITLFGDGSIRRTFTHVEDLCNNIITAISDKLSINQVFNVGGENLSLLEAGRAIATVYNVPIQFKEWPEDSLKLESLDTVFDSTQLDRIHGISYKHNFADWISTQTVLSNKN